MTETAGPAITTAAITHRRVLNIALPLLVSNATIPLLGLVDTAVIGQMGAAAPIGAVGLGGIILSSVYMLFTFLGMGTSGLTAQAHGRGQPRETALVLHRALLIASLCGAALILLHLPVLAGAFALSPASDEVEDLARSYVSIRIWGAPATIAIYAMTGWLIAQERTRAVLMLQLCINGINIVLDVVFVISLGLGVPGVAAATLIGEWTGFCLALWLCRAAFVPAMRSRWGEIAERVALKRIMAMNADLMLRSVLLQASYTSFVFLSAGQGDVSLAANQLLLQFLHLFSYMLDAFAYSAEALVGQAVGARAVVPLRRAAILSGQWALGGSLVLTTAALFGGPQLITLMTTAPDVQAEAMRYLPWVWIMPLASFGSFIFDGIFIGATLSRQMRNVMFMSLIFYLITIVIGMPLIGNHALWLGIIVMSLSRTLLMARAYPQVEAKARLPQDF
ncbi:MAG: MATE family efflux transporter [Pseudotabrizicola sp.]|uniref:MATE family efflux transporter n=1 Tax=Pseudotabrizicola sp. TaxID=2939647 RepID=UPI00272557EF|nr:MATE family efflux transporter [Pseudotabrizicola sp.]MDO9637039.1 MATE family efflux transporter [Pseudotabrizicola sp.]